MKLFNPNQPLYTEERYNHMDCDDLRERLYVKRTKKGWLWHCFNCGASGLQPISKGGTSLNETLQFIKDKNTKLNVVSSDAGYMGHISLPYDMSPCLPLLAIHWLNKYGISEVEAHKYHFGYSEKLNRLILPLYDSKGELIFWQGRGLASPTKDFPKYINMRGPKGKYATFKSKERDHSTICLTEDILSAIRVSSVVDSIPILGSYISTPLLRYLKPYTQVLLWLDFDKKFESLKYSQKIRLNLGVPCRSIITKEDPKCYSEEEIKTILSI